MPIQHPPFLLPFFNESDYNDFEQILMSTNEFKKMDHDQYFHLHHAQTGLSNKLMKHSQNIQI